MDNQKYYFEKSKINKFFKKYIIYKNKYNKLKNQIAGDNNQYTHIILSNCIKKGITYNLRTLNINNCIQIIIDNCIHYLIYLCILFQPDATYCKKTMTCCVFVYSVAGANIIILKTNYYSINKIGLSI
jgi:hypothetical protein